MVRDAKHTPGPVRWEKLRGNCVSLEVDGPREPGRKARILIHNADWPMTEADMRRIQALWNACEGIPTEALESGVVREMIEALEALVTSSYDVTPASEMDELWRLAERVLTKARGQSLGLTIVRAVQTDVGIAHVDYGARLDCPCPDLCYGEMCVAPDICHDPEIHRNPDEWRRRLEAIKRELDGEEGEAS